MEAIIGYAMAISLITIGFTEMVKRTIQINHNLIPPLAVVIGVVVSIVTHFIPELVPDMSIQAQLLSGVVSGLMATGIWETVRIRDKKNKE